MVRREETQGVSQVRGQGREGVEDRLDTSKADACPSPLVAVTSSTPSSVHHRAIKLQFSV